mgnify:CR=1 FL=1
MKAIILMALFQLNLNAATKVIDSEVNFTAVGRPAFIKATGILPIEKADLTLKEGMLTGNIEVPLSKLNSGIETRDEHLKEKYLEVAKYPKAKFLFLYQKHKNQDFSLAQKYIFYDHFSQFHILQSYHHLLE